MQFQTLVFGEETIINNLNMNSDTYSTLKMSSDDEKDDHKPFLDEEDEESVVESFRARRKFICNPYTFILLQVFLVAIYTTTFYFLNTASGKSETISLSGFPSVLESLMTYPKVFPKHGNHNSPYSQPPSPATTNAWVRMLEGGNMRITQSEMSQFNSSSIRIADGSGDFLAKMGFYHELHCLYKLKTHLYPSHYYPNATPAFMEEELEHLEHCIEWIRTAAVCRGDTTLTLFEWAGKNGEERLETKYPVPHMCYREDELLGWSRREKRMVDINVPGVLEGPGGQGQSHLSSDGS